MATTVSELPIADISSYIVHAQAQERSKIDKDEMKKWTTAQFQLVSYYLETLKRLEDLPLKKLEYLSNPVNFRAIFDRYFVLLDQLKNDMNKEEFKHLIEDQIDEESIASGLLPTYLRFQLLCNQKPLMFLHDVVQHYVYPPGYVVNNHPDAQYMSAATIEDATVIANSKTMMAVVGYCVKSLDGQSVKIHKTFIELDFLMGCSHTAKQAMELYGKLIEENKEIAAENFQAIADARFPADKYEPIVFGVEPKI